MHRPHFSIMYFQLDPADPQTDMCDFCLAKLKDGSP